MQLLYSNILPLGTSDDQLTIIDCFKEQLAKADYVEIAVGYVSRASLEELDSLISNSNIKQIFNKLSKEIKGTENATIQLLSTMIIVAVYVALKQEVHFTIPSGSVFPVLWIGLLNTGLGFYFYFSSLSSLPAQTVAVFGYLEPLSAVFFSVLILQERMLTLQIIGSILILTGTILLNIRRRKPPDQNRSISS